MDNKSEKKQFKVTNAQIAIGLVCLLMAFAVTLQIKSVISRRARTSVESIRAADLQAQLAKEQEKSNKLLEQIIELKDQNTAYKNAAATSSDASSVLSQHLEKAELLAGLTAVEGPGLIVTVRDGRQILPPDIDPNSQVVHDGDILSIINTLCDAGAEAISLNGERLIATSEIRCAGATVSINNTRYAEPFEIRAIGDPANLEGAVMMSGGVYDSLTGYGIEMSVKKSDKLSVNSYKGKLEYKYATPVLKEGDVR